MNSVLEKINLGLKRARELKEGNWVPAFHNISGPVLGALGVNTQYRRFGDSSIAITHYRLRKTPEQKEPRRLVFVPGWGESSLLWVPTLSLLVPTLRKHFDEVVFLDLPGYRGILADQAHFPKAQSFFRSTHEVLLSLHPKVLVGYSIGGWLTSRHLTWRQRGEFMPTHPVPHPTPQLERWILINPSGVHQGGGFEDQWRDIFEKVKVGEAASFIEKILPQPKSRFKWLQGESLRFVSQPEIKTFIESVTPEYDVFSSLSDLTVPVKLIWSEHDALLPFSLSEEWKKGFRSDVELLALKNRTHMPHLERPWQVAQTLKKALSGI